MKNLLLSIMMLFAVALQAQDKNAKATLEVDGVCFMCKERIEKAAIRTKGVKTAVWNMETHELKMIYDQRKTDMATIEGNIAAVGHDTQNVTATLEAYNSVDPCCRYRDNKVVKDHQGMGNHKKDGGDE